MTFKELQNSLKIFGLNDRATMQQIKTKHRELVKAHHPDCSGEALDTEHIQKVNAAYSILLNYIEGYHFSFNEEEFYIQNPEENIRRQFMDDPLWGGKGNNE